MFTRYCCFSFFLSLFQGHTGLSTQPSSSYSKTKGTGRKRSSKEQRRQKQICDKKLEGYWQDRNEINCFHFGKHSSRRSKLFKIYRWADTHRSAFSFQTNHCRLALKEPSRVRPSVSQWFQGAVTCWCRWQREKKPLFYIYSIKKRQINCPADLYTFMALKRAMTLSIDHSTSAHLMHVKRSG